MFVRNCTDSGGCTSLLGGGENARGIGEAVRVGGCTSLLGSGENVERLHANCLEGGWLRNGARAKSGLNKSILASAWGQTQTYLQYKARRQGKLVVSVPPFFSSQECAACGHVHQDNRVSQSVFVCHDCGNTDHADHNAAKVIAMRGVRQMLDGRWEQKEKKRCGITRKKVGAEGSEPAAPTQLTPGEIAVSRRGGNTPAPWSMTPETHATRPQGL